MKNWFCRLAWPMVLAGCAVLLFTAVWPEMRSNGLLLGGWLLIVLGVVAYVLNEKRRNGY